MNNKAILCITIAISFCFGFTLNAFIPNNINTYPNMKKVTGIGGIFFKCKDPNNMKEWYKQNLGLHTDQYGAVFEWYQGADNTKKDLPSGVLLMPIQNILAIPVKNL